jgi:hypothetical protein
MLAATWMGVVSNFTPTFALHFGEFVLPGYIGLFALTFNLIVTAILTFIFDAARVPRGLDKTRPEDYVADSSGASRTGVRKIIVT